jgi:hypothetical protein
MQSTVQQQRRTQHLTELRQEREREEQERRDKVIAEFNGDMQALADEILYHRRSRAQLAETGSLGCRRAPRSSRSVLVRTGNQNQCRFSMIGK